MAVDTIAMVTTEDISATVTQGDISFIIHTVALMYTETIVTIITRLTASVIRFTDIMAKDTIIAKPRFLFRIRTRSLAETARYATNCFSV